MRRVIGAALGQLILGLMILFALDVYFLANKASAVYTAGLLVLLSLPLMMLQYYVSHIVQGLGDIKWVNVLRVSGPGLYSCGVLAVSFVGLTVIRCSLIWIVSQLVAAAVAAVHLVHRERRSVRRSNRHGTRALPTARSIARFAIAGFLAQISPIESFRLDTLVVAALFPSRIVGYYSVANSVTNLPLFSADALSAVAYPHVAEQDGSDAVNASRHYMKLGALIAGALAAVSALAIPFAIPLLFGHAYSPAIGTAELLACAAVVLGLRRLGNDLLRGLGRPSLSTRLEMITLVVFAASLLVFGPVGAGRGVAVSLIVAAGLGIVLFGRSLRRTEEEGRVQRLVPEQTD